MQFIALSSISKFDDFYAINLRNNKINSAIGKILKINFKRYMLDSKKTEAENDDGFVAQNLEEAEDE